MALTMDILTFVVGLAVLTFGAHWFVHGAVRLAKPGRSGICLTRNQRRCLVWLEPDLQNRRRAIHSTPKI